MDLVWFDKDYMVWRGISFCFDIYTDVFYSVDMSKTVSDTDFQ